MAAPVETGLTVDDLARYERDDGRRYELIDGALYVSPAPLLRHQRVALRIARRLLEYAETHGGEAFAGANVSLSDRDLVIPDAVLCSADTLSRMRSELAVDVPPDLVVEVCSPSTRRYDLVTKRAHYERVEVPEYWFVDLDADRVEVYRLAGGRYGPPAIGERGGVL
jgi:Uma2 family endonuclease